jgi:hypothetical protein
MHIYNPSTQEVKQKNLEACLGNEAGLQMKIFLYYFQYIFVIS